VTPPLPQLQSIAVIADRFPDGTYGATVNIGPDVSYSLPGPRARRYAVRPDAGDDGWQWTPADTRRHARHVLEAVAAAEEDNRLAAVLRGNMDLELDVVAAVIDHMQGHWPDAEDR
jgi:hypothetical protein